MKRFLPLVLAALLWAGCGGKGSSPSTTTVAVTISPTTASVAGAATQQFTATVTGSTNTAVTWSVNGEVGGDTLIGTVSTTGLYTAPTKLPSTTTVTVTATSVADTTKAAPARVTLTAPTVTISIAPTSANVPAGGTVHFTPTVTSTDNNTAVTWSVSGCAAVAANCGTVDQNGNYTAPLSPPNEAITVTAAAVTDTAFFASAPITVQFGKASLNGSYVFLAEQADNSSGSRFAFRGGVFTADGNGNITGGITDSNSSAGPPLPNLSITSGTYSVGSDGRGAATIVDAKGSHRFAFALTSSTRGQLIQFDSSAVTSGFLRHQDQTAIGSISGPFVFSLFGDNSGPFAEVGQMSFSSGAISGTVDANNVGSVAQQVGITGGTFTVGASGRGTAIIPGAVGTSNFAFYIIDASDLIFVDLDASGPRTAGPAYAQTTTSFSPSSLVSSVYFVNGNTVSGAKPYAQAGRFDTNGSGAFGGGIFDINNAGTATNASFANGATYSLSGNGRFQISTGTSALIVWLASPNLGVVMQADTTAAATGLLLQQQTPFQSITGGFDFAVAGASADGTSPEAISAQLTTGGFGVLSGTEDVNIAGATTPGATIGGNLTIGTNGRGTSTHNVTGTLNGSTVTSNSYSFYFANPNRFILLTTDSKVVLSGVAERQCSDCTF